METTLTLYVRYLAKPGCRESFLRQLTTEGIIDAIRREDGCLRYDYFLSVQNADEILLVEQWESEEKQQVHLRTAHMDRLREPRNRSPYRPAHGNASAALRPPANSAPNAALPSRRIPMAGPAPAAL